MSGNVSKFMAMISVFALMDSSCRNRSESGSSTLRTTAQSTTSTLKEISDNIARNSWKYEINHEAYNNEIYYPTKLRNSMDFFGAPYNEVQACDDSRRIEANGKPACIAYDNLMTYDYHAGTNTQGFVNLIPQRLGESQPEMNKYMQEGDVIVYFHPEYRGGQLNDEAMQWRASHAATIVKKNGKLATADTPSGYAQPFTGVDTTAFHVYRFMPKDAQGNDLPEDVAQKYRQMIAKWAVLGFDQFSFNPSYDSAAGTLTSEDARKNIAKFGEFYLKSQFEGNQANFPSMYCAWFVYTNLSLAWMFPMNERGLSGLPSADKVVPRGKFENIKNDFEYQGKKEISAYIDNDPGLVPHKSYPFRPMTAYELIRGFLTKVVGPDVADPNIFVPISMNKAGILSALASQENIIGTLEPREGNVPHFDNRVNPNVKNHLLKIAALYQAKAEEVKNTRNAAEKVQKAEKAVNELNKAYLSGSSEKEEDALFRGSKRWIPPYFFGYVANNLDTRVNADFGNQVSAKPMMAYIGTVVPEQFVREVSGGNSGSNELLVIPSSSMTDADKKLDKEMYKIMGDNTPSSDGKGYQKFFKCLEKPMTRGCPTDKIINPISAHEAQALKVYANDWRVYANNRPLRLKAAIARNSFGIDSVQFRRLLASYWNNPMDAFRPNLMNGSSRAIKNTALNIRILMSSPINRLNREQRSEDAAAHRQTPMPCMVGQSEIPAGSPPSCSHSVVETNQTVKMPENESEDGWYKDFP